MQYLLTQEELDKLKVGIDDRFNQERIKQYDAFQKVFDRFKISRSDLVDPFAHSESRVGKFIEAMRDVVESFQPSKEPPPTSQH